MNRLWSATLLCLALISHTACTNQTAQTGDSTTPGADTTQTDTPDTSATPIEACPNDPNGQSDPGLYEQNMLQAVSDGSPLKFKKVAGIALEHASEGDAVRGPDGKIWLYFMNGLPGQRGIFVAYLDGDLFKTFDCVRFEGKVRSDTADPDIVRLPDGSYRIFYSEFRLPNRAPGAKRGIYTATSIDGIHFGPVTRVIEFEEVQAPSAVRLADGTWLAAVAGAHGTNIRLLKSTDDAKTFVHTGLEWGPGIPELALFEGGVLRMYYGADGMMKILRSDDNGKSWNLEAEDWGLQSPSVFDNGDGTWRIFYKTVN